MAVNQLNSNALDNNLHDLLAFKPEDAYRCDRATARWEVLNLSSIFLRVIFSVVEYFSGGVVRRDNEAFDALYRSKIVEPLQNLTEGGGPETFKERAKMLRTLMKVHAKIDVSRWGDNLRSNRNYISFRANILAAQTVIIEEAQARPELWEPTPEDRVLKRWMDSNLEQRRFAAFCNAGLPYLWSEMPAGAVVLTNYRSMEVALKLKGHKLTWGQWLFSFKTHFCKLFTGKPYTHAELSLGRGETFDLDKKGGSVFQGEVRIQNRLEGNDRRLCYHDVFVPRHDEMVQAYNGVAREGEAAANFGELWAKIDTEARAHYQQIQASPWDILKVALPFSRPAGYDATQAWQPGVKRYGCSALITALMGKYGIDIGAQFNKQAQNVSPADFSRSNFYQPYFVANSN